MKKKFIFFLAVVLFCGAQNLWADRAGYEINDYSFEGIYNSNNTVTVKEVVTVNFYEPRHGIYHNIPEFMYLNFSSDPENPDVHAYTNKVKKYDVNGDSYSTEHDGEYFVFKVGSANREVTGLKTYEFYYTYEMPEDRDKTTDYIFYSVLGADWNTNIKNFRFAMEFPNGVPENITCYSGDYGNANQAFDVHMSVKGNFVTGYASDINPKNAITLFATVPEGYFSGEAKRVSSFLVWLVFGLAIIVNVYALFKCFTAEKKTPVETVEFYPPEGICSAEVGTIIDNSVDDDDLISLIPWFAHKGYLTISDEGTKRSPKVTLTKIKDLPSDSPNYQKTFFDGLFAHGNEVNLENLPKSFVTYFTTAKTELNGIFTGDKKLYDQSNILGFLSVVLCALFMALDSPVKYFENLFAAILPGIYFGLGIFRDAAVYSRFLNPKKFVVKSIFFTVLLSVITLIFMVFISDEEHIVPAIGTWILLILTIVLKIFEFRLMTPTDWNIEISGKLLGLRNFIKAAELPRLKMLVDENPTYFYDILPYAMVFGLTDKWTNLFKDLEVKQPDWYRMPSGVMFNPMIMHDSISKGISSSISSAIARETSKSSGGGGFSGGGGGGGGGGSW